MSLEAVMEGFKFASRVSPRARLVYNALADEVRTPGKCPRWIPENFRGRVCWPGEKLLAEKTGYSERTVRRALTELRTAGIIRSQARMRRGGRGRTSDLFEVFGPAFLPDDQWDALVRLVPGDQPDRSGTTNRTKRVGGTHDQPDNVAPEPSIEPTRDEPPKRSRSRKRSSGKRPRSLGDVIGDVL